MKRMLWTVVAMLLMVTGSAQAVVASASQEPLQVSADRFEVGEHDVLALSPADLLANDWPENLTVTEVRNAYGGTVAMDADGIVFTPTPGFAGGASFEYLASDGEQTAAGNVNVGIVDDAECGDLRPGLDNGSLRGWSWPSCADSGAAVAPTAHDAASTIDTPLDDVGGTVALLTTGLAANAAPAGGPDLGKAWNTDRMRSEGHGLARDVSTFRVTLRAPASHNCLSFDYVLGSDEYAVGTDGATYADGFVASLDDSQFTMGNGGSTATLDAPSAFVRDVFALNSPLLDSGTWTPAPNGTGYDGITAKRTATVGFVPGVHRISLSVFDGPMPGQNTPDADGDTGVFLDNWKTWADPHGCASDLNPHLPHAVDGSQNVYPGHATGLQLVANDTDDDGDQLTVDRIVTAPTHGSVACAFGSCTYTPGNGFLGDDQLTYRVSDGRGGYDVGQHTIHVIPDTPASFQMLGATATTVGLKVYGASAAPLAGTQVQLLVTDDPLLDPSERPVVDTGTTDSEGVAHLSHVPAKPGVYYVAVRSAVRPELIADLGTVFYDPDPITSVSVSGPTFARCSGPSTWKVTARRASGAAVVTGSAELHVTGADDPGFDQFEPPTDFTGGSASVSWTPDLGQCGQQFLLTFSVGSARSEVLVQTTDVSVTASAVPAVATWPAVPTVQGQIRGDGVKASDIPGTLYRATTGAYVASGTPVSATATLGLRTTPPRPSSRTSYKWWLPAARVWSPSVVVKVRPLVSLSATRTTRSLRLTGRTTPARTGTPVQLQQRRIGGAWSRVRTTRTTRASGSLSVTGGAPYAFTLSKPTRTMEYRVVVPADTGREQQVSTVRRVRR